MRYQHAIQQYIAIREASSREWKISPSLIMCVELEIAPDALATFGVAAHSSQSRTGPRFVRVTLFRLHPEREPWVVTSESDDSSMTTEERVVIGYYQGTIRDWISGRDEDLEKSTSTVITERLARRS